MQVASESSQRPLPVLQQTELQELNRKVAELGEWFHNLDLNGVKTAPNHFLGDFPNIKWKDFRSEIPTKMTGM